MPTPSIERCPELAGPSRRTLGVKDKPKGHRVAAMGSAIVGQRCMLSDEGVAMLCKRGYLKPDRPGTIVGLKGMTASCAGTAMSGKP